jgi:hypothetical protein
METLDIVPNDQIEALLNSYGVCMSLLNATFERRHDLADRIMALNLLKYAIDWSSSTKSIIA